MKAYLTKPDNAADGQEGSIGGIGTFAPAKENWKKRRGYYLGNLINYARKANNDVDSANFTTWFKYINHRVRDEELPI